MASSPVLQELNLVRLLSYRSVKLFNGISILLHRVETLAKTVVHGWVVAKLISFPEVFNRLMSQACL